VVRNREGGSKVTMPQLINASTLALAGLDECLSDPSYAALLHIDMKM
jgi:hypothetical protein